jgi:hypothetical protein
MRTWHLLLGFSVCAWPLAAQQADRGVFTIQRGETPMGREEFTFQPSADGGTGGGVLASVARYPAAAPTVQIQAMLEQNEAGAVVALQIDTRQPTGVSRVYGAALKDNLTIRQTTSAAESVREYPRAAGIVILDDSLFAFYEIVAHRATQAGARLPVLFPRTGRRGQLTATLANPTTIDLSGVVTGTLTVDGSGRLMRVVLSDGTSAVRQSR